MELTIAVRVAVLLLELLLFVYFIYTVVAIFRGAAPIPARRRTVRAMLDLLELQPNEKFVDLGSGDGRILREACRRGAIATGYEINPFLVCYTRLRAFISGASTRLTVSRSDLWKADVSQVTALSVYMVPAFMERLEKKLRSELPAGARVVAARYRFPNWTPVKEQEGVFLYIVQRDR